MTHLQGRCRCGKVTHWPKTAKIGDKWKCYSCGFVITMVARGTPGAKPTQRVVSETHAQQGTTFRDASSASYQPRPGDRFCAADKSCACGLPQVCIDSSCDCSRTRACANSDDCTCGRLKVCTTRTCSCSRPAAHTAPGSAVSARPSRARRPQEQMSPGRSDTRPSAGCSVLLLGVCCATVGAGVALLCAWLPA